MSATRRKIDHTTLVCPHCPYTAIRFDRGGTGHAMRAWRSLVTHAWRAHGVKLVRVDLGDAVSRMKQFNQALAELQNSDAGSWADLEYPVYPGRRRGR